MPDHLLGLGYLEGDSDITTQRVEASVCFGLRRIADAIDFGHLEDNK